MNLTKLFDWTYLTHRYVAAGFSWPVRIILLVIFIGALIVAISATAKLKNQTGVKRQALIKLQIWGWSTGLVGLLLMVFREVRTLYLGSRLYLLLWLIIIFIWLGFVLHHRFIQMPKKMRDLKDQAEFDKWLPKKKK